MTTPLDTKLVPKATALITKFGVSRTYTRITGSTSNVTTGTPSVTTENAAVVMTPFDQVSEELASRLESAGSLVRVGDAKTFVKGTDELGFEPKVGDEVLEGGEKWRVVSVKPLSTGTKIAAFELILRK